jgi:hypothetical protein
MLCISKPKTNYEKTIRNNEIPQIYRAKFYGFLNRLVDYYWGLIKEILLKNNPNPVYPVPLRFIEEYLVGFKFVYIGFDNIKEGIPQIEGFWRFIDKEKGIVGIAYNTNVCPERQKFTIIHELFHFCQYIDPKVQDFLDKIIANSILPNEITAKLLDKSADKATSMYLMPEEEVIIKNQEFNDRKNLAKFFGVSLDCLLYRLKECKQIAFY